MPSSTFFAPSSACRKVDVCCGTPVPKSPKFPEVKVCWEFTICVVRVLLAFDEVAAAESGPIAAISLIALRMSDIGDDVPISVEVMVSGFTKLLNMSIVEVDVVPFDPMLMVVSRLEIELVDDVAGIVWNAFCNGSC